MGQNQKHLKVPQADGQILIRFKLTIITWVVIWWNYVGQIYYTPCSLLVCAMSYKISKNKCGDNYYMCYRHIFSLKIL